MKIDVGLHEYMVIYSVGLLVDWRRYRVPYFICSRSCQPDVLI